MLRRVFTQKVAPYDSVKWVKRTARIDGKDPNKPVFEQHDVEVPESWSQQATNIVAQKYFAGHGDQRENSVKQLIDRVVNQISKWGKENDYFAEESQAVFEDELKYILVNQMAAFNSPVWFNLGVPSRKQQASACYIIGVEDSMESILGWIYDEGMIFKGGSGAGTNLSQLRAEGERLSTGGTASGPISFMRGADASAGAIKSGGTTRRAAKLVCLDDDHPDLPKFIHCKAEEERKAYALGDAGWDMSFDGEAWNSVQFQNANNSVQVSDAFMEAVEEDLKWELQGRKDSETNQMYQAKQLLNEMAEAAHACGDPGIQYKDTINAWHTFPNAGPIRSSNPCGEYLSVDNSACNLSSINLMKFLDEYNQFDEAGYVHTIDVMITAMDICALCSYYPTVKIGANARKQRQLGLGYSNLGALLMSQGLPYDSEPGRNLAAAVSSLMTARAYWRSAELSKNLGPYEPYKENAEKHREVLWKHHNASREAEAHTYETHHKERLPGGAENSMAAKLFYLAGETWQAVLGHEVKWGLRNAVVSCIAPTGTISFMMDCATTGIEPELALVKYKSLVGGGNIKIVNTEVGRALKNLRYSVDEAGAIAAYIADNDTIEGAPHLKPEHLPIFDCAFPTGNSTRSIHYNGHVNMMAAVQPFISMGISKTVNMPNSSTVEDIAQVYIDGWKKGLKSIAIYRDGSKRTQPLTTKIEEKVEELVKEAEENLLSAIKEEKLVDETAARTGAEFLAAKPYLTPKPGQLVGGGSNGHSNGRVRLPDTRQAMTHHFSIGGQDGYITVGLYEDGRPGELFVKMSKQGSTISGMLDAWAIALSIGLQYGVPLSTFVNKFRHQRFEPSGFTSSKTIRMATSIIDYVVQWLAQEFMSEHDKQAHGIKLPEPVKIDIPWQKEDSQVYSTPTQLKPELKESIATMVKEVMDGATCFICGGVTVRTGSCSTCTQCGETTGCG